MPRGRAYFVGHIGADDPVVLVIDDAQHADDGLLNFDHLLSRASFGLLVPCCCARPACCPTAGVEPRRVTVLHIDGLDVADMGRW